MLVMIFVKKKEDNIKVRSSVLIPLINKKNTHNLQKKQQICVIFDGNSWNTDNSETCKKFNHN